MKCHEEVLTVGNMPALRVSHLVFVRCTYDRTQQKHTSRSRQRVQSIILRLEKSLDLLQTFALGFGHTKMTHQRNEARRCTK